MKTLKVIGIIIGAIIAILLIVAVFVPKEFSYEKSITINAPVDSVWNNANSLSALDKWSPWNDYDPTMKKEMTGIDGTVGAKHSWNSDIVGSGSQTIVKFTKPQYFETELIFTEPNKSKGKAFVKLVSEGNNTIATWGMTGTMPYPLNLMNLFMNMEKSLGKDWDNGLSSLKKLSEN